MPDLMQVSGAAAGGVGVGGAVIGWLGKFMLERLFKKYEENIEELKRGMADIRRSLDDVQSRITSNNESTLRSLGEIQGRISRIEGVMQVRINDSTQTRSFQRML